MQFCDFTVERAEKQLDQHLDLSLWALPVFTAEGEQRQVPDAFFRACNNKLANALHAAPVSGDSRQPALPCPAAVAVHNDGDVPRMYRCKCRG